MNDKELNSLLSAAKNAVADAQGVFKELKKDWQGEASAAFAESCEYFDKRFLREIDKRCGRLLKSLGSKTEGQR